MTRIALIALLGIFLLAGCGDNSSPSGAKDEIVYPSNIQGFIQVNALGKSVSLGTTDSDAKESERPEMKVTFDYSFALQKSEVTCGEFNEIMGQASLPEGMFTKVDCDEDSLPAVNITYYDAILFANARGLAEKKDTAYTYQSVSLDGNGHCNGLTGLTLRTDVEAFRLPTEAEWVFAASLNWNVSNSWTSENSDYHIHAVCEKILDSLNFCDMEGNAKEFVNDWLGNFSDTTLNDFMGSPQGDNLGQRILKGGSFKHGKVAAKLYRRGDDYVVTSSSRSDYVGFRLVYGSIPAPTWMNGTGASSSNTVSLASSFDVKKLLGTVQAKLVFRNDNTGNLEFIDYSLGSSRIFEIVSDIAAYHPDISPDGKWVAFCTGMEGVDNKSSLYVRRLDNTGSDLVKLDVERAAIPRFRVTSDGDTVIVYVTNSGDNSDNSIFATRSTWQVKFSNGKFGTPVKLFDGAYHGGISKDDRLAVTGSRRLRARTAQDSTVTESIWFDENQACNVSLSKDGTKRTLFLDFGSRSNSNSSSDSSSDVYGVHERILMMDSTGNILHRIPSPEGYAFDHSEWGFGDYAVASLTNNNGAHERISLVNVSTDSVTDLVNGSELWHPALWVASHDDGEKSSLDRDSAGVYLFENDSWASVLMRYNMELLWRYKDSANVAILGSSRPLYSLSPSLLNDDFLAVNFGHTPNSIYASRDLLKNYLLPHMKKLKYVVVSLDIDFWWKTDDGKLTDDNFFKISADDYPGYVYDKNHDYWKDSVPDGLYEATTQSLGVENSEAYLLDRGRFTETFCGSWGGDTPEVEIDSTLEDGSDCLENSMGAFEEIVKECENRDIVVVGMIFPQSPAYAHTGAFGRYGLRRSVADSLIDRIDELSKSYTNFVLMDENKMGKHDYGDEMAVDFDHLCSEGVLQITARLDSLLLGLE